jgi:hypothetical protein
MQPVILCLATNSCTDITSAQLHFSLGFHNTSFHRCCNILAYNASLRFVFAEQIRNKQNSCERKKITELALHVWANLFCLSGTQTWWTLPLRLGWFLHHTHQPASHHLCLSLNGTPGLSQARHVLTGLFHYSLGAAQTKCLCNALSDHLSRCSKLNHLLFSRKSSFTQFTSLSVSLTGGHFNIVNTLQTAAQLENHSRTCVHYTVFSPKTTSNILKIPVATSPGWSKF